jgi:hypothetical protein
MTQKIILIAWMAFTANALATSYAPPKDYDVKSANGKFTLHLNAKENHHEVKGAFESQGGWKFSHKMWHDRFFISDDGETAAIVHWKWCKADQLDEPAVVIYGREGVRATFSYRELSTPRNRGEREVGPIGDLWRVWRSDATLKGNLLTIKVEGRKPCDIDLQTAKLETLPAGAHDTEPALAPEEEEKK